MAQTIERVLERHKDRIQIVGVLRRPQHEDASAVTRIPCYTTLEEIGALACDVALECAGHQVVAQWVPRLLSSGVDVVIASVGALADPEIEGMLRAAENQGKAKLMIPSGAVCGLDGLAAAREAGIDGVKYTARKPPRAWLDTPAEKILDLAGLREPAAFFNGNARDACLQYPKNANVTAAISLAGIGFDRTMVTLVADPGVTDNRHSIAATGAFGRFDISIHATPMPDNLKTSMLSAYSMVSALLARA